MNEIFVTVSGIVGSDVQLHEGERSKRARFRLASTERFLDRSTGEWTDRDTVWMDVVCWRRLAENVGQSIRKGQPVLVRGRLRVTHWQSESGPRQGLELIASSLGHDLTMGRASFTRAGRREEEADRAPQGADRSGSHHDGVSAADDPFEELPPADIARPGTAGARARGPSPD